MNDFPRVINARVFYKALCECVANRHESKEQLVVLMPEWVTLIMVEYCRKKLPIGVMVKIDNSVWPFKITTASEVA